MADSLTKDHFDKVIAGLVGQLASHQDVMHVQKEVGDLKSSFSDLQSSVDRYLHFTQAWHQELTILKKRHDRLAEVLSSKGIVSEQELLLMSPPPAG